MQQKKSINLGFRGWMLVIYQFLAYMALMCFHNWPMNGLSEFYGGAQTITTIFTVASILGGNLAFTIPPAFVPIGVAYADPYCKGSTILKNGLVMTVICVVILFAMIYPLGSVFL